MSWRHRIHISSTRPITWVVRKWRWCIATTVKVNEGAYMYIHIYQQDGILSRLYVYLIESRVMVVCEEFHPPCFVYFVFRRLLLPINISQNCNCQFIPITQHIYPRLDKKKLYIILLHYVYLIVFSIFLITILSYDKKCVHPICHVYNSKLPTKWYMLNRRCVHWNILWKDNTLAHFKSLACPAWLV